MKFEEWVKRIENAAIKGLCSTHPNICKMIYNEGQKDIEKALKDKGVCLQSELDELQNKYKELKKENAELKEHIKADCIDCVDYIKNQKFEEQIEKMKEKHKQDELVLIISNSSARAELEKQLEQAKEILQEYIRINLLPPIERNFDDEVKLFKRAEQFLSEVEK